ncbi:MAG TPA: alginate lyase family protein [Burkholderiales bacterium]|nr:alginate lyase family protein [Burkholderiales bacterium]
MQTLTWTLNRVRAMTPAEVGWRARNGAAALFERLGLGLARDAGPGSGACGAPWVAPLPKDFDGSHYTAAAERILAGRWDVLSLEDCVLGFPPRWNRDPKTGRLAPLAYGKSIDYRDARSVGDIKHLWEINRHLELVTLAQAFHLSRDPRYAEGALALLDSWLEQCPYPRGVQWTSAHEAGVRLMNWAVAWTLLGEAAAPLRERWAACVYRHCHFVARNLSRHSSANNHLFGELTGLFVAAVTWPRWPESRRWRQLAHAGLEAQAVAQNGADGVNREQAFWYHHEVADMMLLALLVGRANGAGFSVGFTRRLEAMLEFVAAVMDAGGHVPNVGDADDALMVRFSREPGFDPYRSLLATGAVLFERGDFKAAAARFCDKSRWLLGDAGQALFDAVPGAPARPPRLAFADAGYYLLGADYGTPRELKVLVDAGPLGYLSIAAHGHADALALTLSAGGREILVDPGTYAYHGERRWRDYFRGTSAHNTLRVDGADQSVPGGPFLWLEHARARCERFDAGVDHDVFEGVHDGYRRLADPVTHRRRVELDKRAREILVRDTLECAREHDLELHWHLAEDCVARVHGHVVDVECAGQRLRIECPRELAPPRIVTGREHLPLGWVSRALGVKRPSPTVLCRGRVGPGSLETRIQVVQPD